MGLRALAARALALVLPTPPAEEQINAFDVDAAAAREESARADHASTARELAAARAEHEAAVLAFDQAGDDPALDRASKARLRFERAERREAAASAAGGAALVQLQHTRLAARLLTARAEEHEAGAGELLADDAFEANVDVALAASAELAAAGELLAAARARKATARASTDAARAELARIDAKLAATAPRATDPALATYPALRTRTERLAAGAAALSQIAVRVAVRVLELVNDQRVAAGDVGAPLAPTVYALVVTERAGYAPPAPPPAPDYMRVRHVNALALGHDTTAHSTDLPIGGRDGEHVVDLLLAKPPAEVRAELFPPRSPSLGFSTRGERA